MSKAVGNTSCKYLKHSSVRILVTCLFIQFSLSCSSQPKPLFKLDLSNAVVAKNSWAFTEDILSAKIDTPIWSLEKYANFILDFDFNNEEAANSGVFIFCDDISKFVAGSLEIQILDDYSEYWKDKPSSWKCGAFFGHQPASKSLVKKPGEWNHFSIKVKDSEVWVTLNGELVNYIRTGDWKSSKKNLDGSEIPYWLDMPLSELPTSGFIGFQGKHADAAVLFKNIVIEEIN